MASLVMRMNLGPGTSVVVSVQGKNEIYSYKNCKNKEKKAVLNSVWLKEVIKRNNIYKLNKYNNIINHV
jgi:hypothetical protein